MGVDLRHQPVRSGPGNPCVRTSDEGAGFGADRQHRLLGWAGAPARHGLLQRRQGSRRGVQRDHRARARPLRRRLYGGLSVVLPHQPDVFTARRRRRPRRTRHPLGRAVPDLGGRHRGRRARGARQRGRADPSRRAREGGLRAEAGRPSGVRRADAGDRGAGQGSRRMSRDESVQVREEDAFDVDAVATWLRSHADVAVVAPEELDGVPTVRQFPGGASNLTYLLRWPARDLILRRPPVGAKARSAHDMSREYVIQRALAPVYPYVAGMVGLCRDDAVIGSDFYVMERIDGLILRKDLPAPLPAEEAFALCEQAWEALALLHEVDVRAVPGLASLGRGAGYVARQVAGWTDRLARAATDDLGDWAPVTSWLEAHRPADVGQCLIHNDWRFDNMVLD